MSEGFQTILHCWCFGFFSVFVILLNLKDFGPLGKQMELVQSRTCCPRNDVPS